MAYEIFTGLMVNDEAIRAPSLGESRPQSHELGARIDLKMSEKVFHVLVNCSRTEHQLGGDLFFGESS